MEVPVGLRDMLVEVVKGRKRRLRKVGMLVKAIRMIRVRKMRVRDVGDRIAIDVCIVLGEKAGYKMCMMMDVIPPLRSNCGVTNRGGGVFDSESCRIILRTITKDKEGLRSWGIWKHHIGSVTRNSTAPYRCYS